MAEGTRSGRIEASAGGPSESGNGRVKKGKPRKKKTNPLALAPRKVSTALTLPFKVGLNYFATYLPGGRETMMDLARLSDCEKVRQVSLLYDELPVLKRATVVIDELCISVGIAPADFGGQITTVAIREGMNAGRMLAAITHPRVVKAAIDRSLKPEGIEDRRMLFQATGFLPTSKGIQITNLNKNVAMAKAENTDAPSFEEVIQQSAQVVRS